MNKGLLYVRSWLRDGCGDGDGHFVVVVLMVMWLKLLRWWGLIK